MHRDNSGRQLIESHQVRYDSADAEGVIKQRNTPPSTKLILTGDIEEPKLGAERSICKELPGHECEVGEKLHEKVRNVPSAARSTRLPSLQPLARL